MEIRHLQAVFKNEENEMTTISRVFEEFDSLERGRAAKVKRKFLSDALCRVLDEVRISTYGDPSYLNANIKELKLQIKEECE